MPTEFKLPELGENIESAEVLTVYVNAGDTINVDDSIIEAETDKAAIDVPSTVAGTVKEVKVSAGDSISIGQVLILVEEGEAAADTKAEEAPKEEPKAEESKSEAPKEEQPQKAEQQTQESAQESTAQTETQTATKPAAPSSPTVVVPGRPTIPAAPAIRQLAREIGVDINTVVGTGTAGRITEEDVKAAARGTVRSAPAASGATSASPTIEPMSKVRQVTAAHMAKCWSEIPHVTMNCKADITDLEDTRKQMKESVAKRGGSLTITTIMIKTVASALKNFPNLNASLDVENKQITQHAEYNIGIAADTPRGLVVPVIRNAGLKSITELAMEMAELTNKARDGKLMPDDMSGGTFTISNVGAVDIEYFTPIVNHPQVAILGIGRSKVEPVWVDGDFEPRLLMPLSLSFDHRLIDGADAAKFLGWIMDAVENPIMMAF